MTEDQSKNTGQEEYSPFWRFVLKYGISIVVGVFYGTSILHFDYTPDDTYIYLQYAKNIVGGDGFSFNAGIPSYGVTGPFWTLLIASGAKLGLDPYMVAKTLDLLFANIAIVILYLLAFAIIRDKIYALIVAWMFSFDAWFLRWTCSGMESSLAVLLALLTVWNAYRKEYATATFVAGMFTLVRPEGFLLFLVVLVDIFLNTRVRASAWRKIISSLALFSVIILTWLLFAYIHFGAIVPNTLQAKSTQGFSLAVVWFTLFSMLKIIGATQVVAALAIVVGFIVVVRRSNWLRIKEDAFPLLWVIALPLLYIVMNVQVVSRYLLPISPFIVLYGVWGIKQLELSFVLSPHRALMVLVIVIGVSLAANQFVYRSKVVPHTQNFTLGMNECLKPIAYWLRSNAKENATVLAPDIGVLGYVSGRNFYDTAGLISPQVKKAFGGVSYDEGMLQRRYEQTIHPDYIVDRSPTPERLATDSLQPVMTRTFSGLGLAKSDLVYYTLYKAVK
ncbi:MAG: hypothetical protein HY088_01195 [Ignavibacteriales bacterium]|nr:hypothetical protein [Ignavibacteriales bacterium]